MGIILALAGCTSLPSLEDPPNNALSVPPSANLEVARSELPPVNPQQPSVVSQQTQGTADPVNLAPTTLSAPPANTASGNVPLEPAPDAGAGEGQMSNSTAKAPPEPEIQAAPEAAEGEDLASLAASEPPMKELAPGAYEGVYSKDEGIEVFSEDGNLCVGRKVGGQGKLKTGMVLPIACSNSQLGEVKITRVIDGGNALASLKLDDKTSQKIGVTIQD